MKTAFIGNERVLGKNICERLMDAVRNEIDCGCRTFTMGINGEFDNFALNVCKWLRNDYKDLNIEVAITNPDAVKTESERGLVPYSDVNTVTYGTEATPDKERVALSNRRMIDTCDTLICYVDTTEDKSEAEAALRYAEKNGLKIVNLYRKDD